ncbi:hypothetical protein PHLCEN_2v10370 [Hermanssonia centrifuga]|uniref:Uncharacterized protein n=1 Tax=Hermanssonia centrifuga TaxID=98765 RepID=A0A2R6NN37_9APHY|nr:hypothetical protein PHLCEN_2v10370 [Hermanssonia centrifuga]
MLDAALENNVQAIWLAFGNNIGQWVNYIREKNQRDGQKTLVFVQVNSLAEALVAVNEWKTDVLIAQGIESGGHGGGYAPSVFSLVSSILAALPKHGPPLLAAGGLATGAQVASFLTLGAAGAALGTRFLLTPDSLYSVPQKAALLAADSNSTVRTLAFDRARNTLGWPQGIDGRGLRNEIVQDVEDGTDISIVRKKFAERAQSGEPSYTIVWAGTGVGEMHEIKGAQQIVQEFHQEILERVQASQGLVGDSETQI